MKIKAKVNENSVIEAYEWNPKEEYSPETDGWKIIEGDFYRGEIIPGVTKIKEENGKYVFEDKKEITEDEKAYEKNYIKEEKIRSRKQELSETDYVVTKIAEATALGEDSSSLVKEYSKVLERRVELRKLINEAEE